MLQAAVVAAGWSQPEVVVSSRPWSGRRERQDGRLDLQTEALKGANRKEPR